LIRARNAGPVFIFQLFLIVSALAQMPDGTTDIYTKLRFSGLEAVARSNQSAANDYINASRTSMTDVAVDSNTYIIGPGDQFFILFLNRTSFSYFGVINAEGDLLVPSLGLFRLGKIPLVKAKQRIREELQKKNKNDEPVYVTLATVKNVTIYISGPVKYPGRFVVPGSMRLFDAVKIACDPLQPLLTNLDGRSITRTSGDSTAVYDAMRFMFRGDISQNPYLYTGDCITIPGLTKRAMVLGAVAGPQIGIMPIRDGETVASLLSLYSLEGSADSTYVLLKQTVADTSETTITVPRSEFESQAVYDRDVVTVPSKSMYPEMMSVLVNGEVERPGYYPIVRSKTSAREILDRAGILSTALNARIAVLRPSRAIGPTQNQQERSYFASTLPQSFSRTEMNNAISLMMTTKDYSILRLTDYKDVILEKNDQIIVPRAERAVYISGAVMRPGGYEYSEGKTLLDYISLAGGFNKFADRQNVYRMIKYGEFMQYSNEHSIEDGDVIVVPFSKENKFLNNVVLPALQIFATSITLLVAVITVIR
jgi:protein involved in polysaccharide export with SLBB domain